MAGFYAARDRILPPRLWPSIAPPFTEGPPGAGKSTFAEAVDDRINSAQSGLCEVLPWANLRSFFDTGIMLDVPLKTLEARQTARWAGLGYALAAAKEKISGNDMLNVKQVMENSVQADYVVQTLGHAP